MSDQTEAVTLTGRCHCGAITYTMQGPIVKTAACDCPGCRRASGTMQAHFVTVLRSAFTLDSGEPAVFDAHGDDGCDKYGTWQFCPTCGTHLYWQGHEGEEMDLFAGTLDDVSVYPG